MRCEKELCEVQKQYKTALQNLSKRKDLESIFFLRIMMETGMRPGDVLNLKLSDIFKRKIKKRSLKTDNIEEYPLISKRTERMAGILLMSRDSFFSRSRDTYILRIKRAFSDPSMKLLYMRTYRRDMEDKIRLKKYRENEQQKLLQA